jgi:hypothetical protein
MQYAVFERDAAAVAVHRARVTSAHSCNAATVVATGVAGRATVGVVFVVITAGEPAARVRAARANAIACRTDLAAVAARIAVPAVALIGGGVVTTVTR